MSTKNFSNSSSSLWEMVGDVRFNKNVNLNDFVRVVENLRAIEKAEFRVWQAQLKMADELEYLTANGLPQVEGL